MGTQAVSWRLPFEFSLSSYVSSSREEDWLAKVQKWEMENTLFLSDFIISSASHNEFLQTECSMWALSYAQIKSYAFWELLLTMVRFKAILTEEISLSQALSDFCWFPPLLAELWQHWSIIWMLNFSVHLMWGCLNRICAVLVQRVPYLQLLM